MDTDIIVPASPRSPVIKRIMERVGMEEMQPMRSQRFWVRLFVVHPGQRTAPQEMVLGGAHRRRVMTWSQVITYFKTMQGLHPEGYRSFLKNKRMVTFKVPSGTRHWLVAEPIG
jgi:hypothetical protein